MTFVPLAGPNWATKVEFSSVVVEYGSVLSTVRPMPGLGRITFCRPVQSFSKLALQPTPRDYGPTVPREKCLTLAVLTSPTVTGVESHRRSLIYFLLFSYFFFLCMILVLCLLPCPFLCFWCSSSWILFLLL